MANPHAGPTGPRSKVNRGEKSDNNNDPSDNFEDPDGLEIENFDLFEIFPKKRPIPIFIEEVSAVKSKTFGQKPKRANIDLREIRKDTDITNSLDMDPEEEEDVSMSSEASREPKHSH